jgi:hypothetical protein
VLGNRRADCHRGSALIRWRFRVSSVTTHDDAPDDDEHADREQQVDPSGSVEHECANCPDDDERYPYDDAEIHELTGCAIACKLPM